MTFEIPCQECGGAGFFEHYVEYLYPGSLFPEESERRIGAHWDLAEALKYLQPDAFSFSFFDVQVRQENYQ